MKYAYKAIIILLAAFAVLFAINKWTDVHFNTLHLSLLSMFMFGTSMLVHHFTMKASEENPKRFPAYFMAITGIKMMVYIILLGVYVFVFKESAIPVVIAFLALYLSFTSLEVFSAISGLKNKD